MKLLCCSCSGATIKHPDDFVLVDVHRPEVTSFPYERVVRIVGVQPNTSDPGETEIWLDDEDARKLFNWLGAYLHGGSPL